MPEQFGEIKIAGEAVIIFFVLSGYLVGGSVIRSLRRGSWSWSNYLVKRLTRLYVVLIPALAIGLGLDCLGSHVFGAGSVYTSPPGIGIVTTFNLMVRLRWTVFAGNLLFLEGIRVPIAGTNVSLWSLANEFWYYLVFPMLCLTAMAGRRIGERILWCLLAIVTLCFVGKAIAVLFLIWLMGAAVSVLPRKVRISKVKRLSAASLLLLLLLMLSVRIARWPTLPADLVIGLATSLLIYLLVQQTQESKNTVYRRVAGFFSHISYSLYLFHLPIAMFLAGILNTPWYPWISSPRYVLAFLAADSGIVVCVYGLWWLFERNTDFIRRFVFGSRGPAVPNSVISSH
jgi:peptidoglycan/LPS O-acetylase OafA/YrhL